LKVRGGHTNNQRRKPTGDSNVPLPLAFLALVAVEALGGGRGETTALNCTAEVDATSAVLVERCSPSTEEQPL
jgi:hypothetical protein